MSQQVWMFQRYEQVLEYKSTPIVPPPLTPLVHLFMLVKHFCSVSDISFSCKFVFHPRCMADVSNILVDVVRLLNL